MGNACVSNTQIEYETTNVQPVELETVPEVQAINIEEEPPQLPESAYPIEQLPTIQNERVAYMHQILGPYILRDLPDRQTYTVEILVNNEFHTNEKVYYHGQWLNQQRDGFGIQIYPDGSYYEGYWKENQHDGEGRILYSDGDYYKGEWRDGQYHGFGRLQSKQFTYEGQWQQNLKHGRGIEDSKDGTRFEGLYDEGKKVRGIILYKDKSQYEGDLMDGMYHGNGKYRWKDGKIYVGQWSYNKMHGYVFIKGYFTNDHKDGDGEFRWPDGRTLKGKWLDGKLEGEATLSEINGSFEKCSFQNGQRIE